MARVLTDTSCDLYNVADTAILFKHVPLPAGRIYYSNVYVVIGNNSNDNRIAARKRVRHLSIGFSRASRTVIRELAAQ